MDISIHFLNTGRNIFVLCTQYFCIQFPQKFGFYFSQETPIKAPVQNLENNIDS